MYYVDGDQSFAQLLDIYYLDFRRYVEDSEPKKKKKDTSEADSRKLLETALLSPKVPGTAGPASAGTSKMRLALGRIKHGCGFPPVAVL